MDLEQLHTLVAVLEHRSFSRAASTLGLSQSTVSFHVQSLERSVGVRLLDRRGGQVRATRAGALLQRDALRMLSLRDEALARLRAEETGETGRVTVAASTIPAEYLLPPVLAGFRRERPRVAVTVEVSDSRRAIAQLLAGACDIAVVGARTRDASLRFRAIARDEVVVVGARGGPWATRRRLTRAELARMPWIVREEGSGTRDAVEAALHGLPLDPQGPAPLRVGSSEAARRCALEGAGLAFLSLRAAAEDLRLRRLVRVPLRGTPVRRRFWLVERRRVTLPAAARALCDVMVRKTR